MAVHTYKLADGSTVYCAAYGNPSGRRTIEQVRTVPPKATKTEHKMARSKAAARAHEQRAAVRNKEWTDPHATDPEKLSFEELAGKFLEQYRPRSGKMRYYEERARAWNKYFGSRPVASITPEDVEAFRKSREEGTNQTGKGRKLKDVKRYIKARARYKEEKGQRPPRRLGAGTVRKDLISLGTLFRWAKARGLVATNPADPDIVKRPPEPPNRTDYLTVKEEQDLLEACEDWLRPIVRFALRSGMDRSEVLSLLTRDVDNSAGIVHAPRSKTSVPREVPIGLPGLREALTEALSVRSIQRDKPEPVFLYHGKAINPPVADAALGRALEAAKLTGRRRWKLLRHTFGTRCAEAGLSQAEIQYLMGHRNPSTTGRYMHLSPDHMKGALKKLQAHLHMTLHNANAKPAWTRTVAGA